MNLENSLPIIWAPISGTTLSHIPLKRQHSDDAGFDIAANAEGVIAPDYSAIIPTGIKIKLPPKTTGFVCSRSGLAFKNGVFVLNAPGIIDQGYRGEVKVCLHNSGNEPFHYSIGMRIAQLLLVPVFIPAEPGAMLINFDVEDTTRGTKGYGSTGV